jgi:low temperature requirement protein LtrA
MSEVTSAGGETVIPGIRVIRSPAQQQRATFFELFFDLVYVFAVTQLSHYLLATELSWLGAAETAFMLTAVYWAWNYTTWMANWFDPDTVPVRLILIFVMLSSLLMAVAIPEGFGNMAILFASSYVALQVGRNAFVVGVTPSGTFNRNFRHILAWSMLSAPLWVFGGLVDELRWPLWLVALGMDLVAPLVRFWLPRLGGTATSQWQIDADHFAERFQLFVIIALGESIVLTGVTASEAGFDGWVATALGLAFLATTAQWWLYFSGASRLIVHRISGSTVDEMGALGRDVYTYLHFPVIAGIVLLAVGDELVVAHPNHDLGVAGAIVTLGGVVLYLIGLMATVARIGYYTIWPKAVTVAVLIAGIPLVAQAHGVLTLAFIVVTLVALMVVEWWMVDRHPELFDT